jgi:hypothetical protein
MNLQNDVHGLFLEIADVLADQRIVVVGPSGWNCSSGDAGMVQRLKKVVPPWRKMPTFSFGLNEFVPLL